MVQAECLCLYSVRACWRGTYWLGTAAGNYKPYFASVTGLIHLGVAVQIMWISPHAQDQESISVSVNMLLLSCRFISGILASNWAGRLNPILLQHPMVCIKACLLFNHLSAVSVLAQAALLPAFWWVPMMALLVSFLLTERSLRSCVDTVWLLCWTFKTEEQNHGLTRAWDHVWAREVR